MKMNCSEFQNENVWTIWFSAISHDFAPYFSAFNRVQGERHNLRSKRVNIIWDNLMNFSPLKRYKKSFGGWDESRRSRNFKIISINRRKLTGKRTLNSENFTLYSNFIWFGVSFPVKRFPLLHGMSVECIDIFKQLVYPNQRNCAKLKIVFITV